MSHQSSLISAKHQDKLKCLLVLKGYSKMAYGREMEENDQQQQLHIFFNGEPPNKVSNIDLVCK